MRLLPFCAVAELSADEVLHVAVEIVDALLNRIESSIHLIAEAVNCVSDFTSEGSEAVGEHPENRGAEDTNECPYLRLGQGDHLSTVNELTRWCQAGERIFSGAAKSVDWRVIGEKTQNLWREIAISIPRMFVLSLIRCPKGNIWRVTQAAKGI